MQRRERQSCGVIHANGANWAFFSRDSHELKNLNVLTNQELALAVTSLRAEAENPKTTMEDKVIVVVCGYPELYIHLRTFTKTGIHFATRLELPGRSPSHDVNSRHSRQVWTHLYRVKSSHLYLYSAFNNTNFNKALHNIKIGKLCQ